MIGDLIYNALLSGAITAGAGGLVYFHQKRTGASVLSRAGKNRSTDERIMPIVSDVSVYLENYLNQTTDYKVNSSGIHIDLPALVDRKIKERIGIVEPDVFEEITDKRKDYHFVINYTSAAQQGFSNNQRITTTVTKTLAKAISNLNFPLAINAIGKDLTFIKRYQDDLDLALIDKKRTDYRLNYTHSMDLLANYYGTHTNTIFLTVTNGSSTIADKLHKPKNKLLQQD